jgi:NAD(P)-dependent dehydrogenase (short-subunit alcohol dehydrogenase family)
MNLVPDRTVIVTGSGGTGCGRAIALRFASAGAAVVVSDINQAGGAETVRLIENSGGRASFLAADVRDERQMRDLVEFGEKAFGPLAAFVNNASGPLFRPDRPLDGWTDTVATELLGTMNGTRCAVEAMRRSGGGAIVNIASASALGHGRETRGAPAYDAAKAGIIRLTTSLAWLAADRIRVNCLAPGWIATDGPRSYWESLTAEERVKRGVPSRLLAIAAVANVVLRIATDPELAGRVLVWSSEEDRPRLIRWADEGYRQAEYGWPETTTAALVRPGHPSID